MLSKESEWSFASRDYRDIATMGRSVYASFRTKPSGELRPKRTIRDPQIQRPFDAALVDELLNSAGNPIAHIRCMGDNPRARFQLTRQVWPKGCGT